MIPGRGVALATTMTIVAIVVVVPLSALVLSLHGITPARLHRDRVFAGRARRVPAQLRRRDPRVGDRRRGRRCDRVRARALSVALDAPVRRARRRAVRVTAGRHRDHLGRVVRAARLDRLVARRARHPDRLYAGRRAARAHVRRAAVRRAHRAAGDRHPAARVLASGSLARRAAFHDLAPHHAAAGRAGVPHRLRAVARAHARRIRLGHLHRRQHAGQDRGRSADRRSRGSSNTISPARRRWRWYRWSSRSSCCYAINALQRRIVDVRSAA